MSKKIIAPEYNKFFADLKERVASSRYKAALSVNKELIILYHHIGTQILAGQAKQGWGAKVIDQLSKDLASEFPEMKGFSTRNLKYMRKFAEEYPDIQFVQEVLAQLTWYHNVTLLDKIADKQTRLFYMKHAIEYGWSRNIMVIQIELALHKRQGQAITNFKDKLPSPQSDFLHACSAWAYGIWGVQKKDGGLGRAISFFKEGYKRTSCLYNYTTTTYFNFLTFY